MKRVISTVLLALTLLTASSIALAADQTKGIPADGKGATEAAAIEDMKSGVIKRILGNITTHSDDPASPYQQLLKRYREFIESFTVEKKGKTANGYFVTGKVKPRYHEMQAELGKLVQAAHQGDDARQVCVFVRFVGAPDEQTSRLAENAILDRYNVRFRENKFVVATGDEILGELQKTRAMSFNRFVDFVKQKSLENPEICTAVIGEMTMAKLSEDSEGVTVSCDMNIRTPDCFNNFAVIDSYEGGEVLRWRDLRSLGTLLFEKAAISSAKAIAEKLVTYWKAH